MLPHINPQINSCHKLQHVTMKKQILNISLKKIATQVELLPQHTQ